MFRLTTLCWSLFLILTAGWTAWHLTRVTEDDRSQLLRLMDHKTISTTDRPHKGVYSQLRNGVRRDVWTSKDGERLQMTQRSALATLSVNRPEHAVLEELEGEVALTTCQGWELTCDRALLDQETGRGRFEATGPDACVEIRAEWQQGAECPVPLKLYGRSMELQMANSRNVVACTAEGEASLQYGEAWRAYGDRVLYQRQESADDRKPVSLNGVFTLEADSDKFCRVTHAGGSQITANQMTFDLSTQELTLTQAVGQLCTEQGGVAFKAGVARWNHKTQRLTLTDDVIVSHGGRSLSSQGEVYVDIEANANGMSARQVTCIGSTELVMGSAGEKLHCQGTITADLVNQRVGLCSPLDESGKVAAERQITYKGVEGELTSDQLTIAYTLRNGEAEPTHFMALGHVCLARRTELGNVQYALADTWSFHPADGAMTFQAQSPRRVIFFDRQYELKVSAPEVQMTRDPETGREKIRGLGDLRMTLLDNELEQLRARFGVEGNKKS